MQTPVREEQRPWLGHPLTWRAARMVDSSTCFRYSSTLVVSAWNTSSMVGWISSDVTSWVSLRVGAAVGSAWVASMLPWPWATGGLFWCWL